uniref:3CxxC-type domain-containing protein n=2 Tax=Gasterosteus aculeatus TaxID=69293 RepID=A0AAQ4RHX4_GASAC|nr:receptor-transporting protein 3-like [Gasterosteus aculeatus aculeatus]
MALSDKWTAIFEEKARALKQGDSWILQFDDSLVPDRPNAGWQQYIRTTSAWFACMDCGRSWPSNRVMVVFHMRLSGGQGVVKVRRFRQNCKECEEAPMDEPAVSPENIDIVLTNLMEKIRIKCYHEDLGQANRPFVKLNVKSPHEPDHCEGCIQGICDRS